MNLLVKFTTLGIVIQSLSSCGVLTKSQTTAVHNYYQTSGKMPEYSRELNRQYAKVKFDRADTRYFGLGFIPESVIQQRPPKPRGKKKIKALVHNNLRLMRVLSKNYERLAQFTDSRKRVTNTMDELQQLYASVTRMERIIHQHSKSCD